MEVLSVQEALVEAQVTQGRSLYHYSFMTRINPYRFDEWECYKLSDCDFDKQCQGTPGRCIDPCTNDVNTGDIVTTQTL